MNSDLVFAFAKQPAIWPLSIVMSSLIIFIAVVDMLLDERDKTCITHH